MANHRAGKREGSRVSSPERSVTTPRSSTTGGKRKAVKPSRTVRNKPSNAVVERRTQAPRTQTSVSPDIPIPTEKPAAAPRATQPAAAPRRTAQPAAPGARRATPAPRRAAQPAAAPRRSAKQAPEPSARRVPPAPSVAGQATAGPRRAAKQAPEPSARRAAQPAPRRAAQQSPAARRAIPVSAKQPARRPAPRPVTQSAPTARSFNPSAPSLLGVAALVVAATGAVTVTPGITSVGADELQKVSLQASALTGSSQVEASGALDDREQAVSRDSQREALEDAAADELQAAAEAQAKERTAALAELAASAEKYAEEIAANAWVLPLADYRLTAGFGESSGLWASTHTGLDFAAPSGTPVMSVANGTVTYTGYDGSYGNQLIVTLEDGTEIWYNHLTSFMASPGDTVRGGEVIATVGSTGNSTGPHLHLEVRPGAGDPVDPYAALIAQGLQP